NGQHLYISRYSHVMQYQFANNDFHKVCGMDTAYNDFMAYTSLQLGFDNKIYIGHFHGFSRQMSVIDNPDGQGAACNFCRKCLKSKSTNQFNTFGTPPNMPNYELGARGQPSWPLSSTQFEVDSLQLAVYPNPASNVFYVQTHSKHKRELYTDIGKLLISTDLNEIDVSNYSKGIYYIKVGSAVRKVVVE
ncbi:MAG: T9SS type A sorting domain-containing protein, partial [Chitinophagaceae bacterium]|nr:T9SS type A sorting domain-containing protein [Chitinophagaceae bacterium]